MTVESSAVNQTFAGTQSTLTFSFRTLVSNPEYVKLKVVNTTTLAETILTYNTDYTVAVAADGVGGVVTVSPTYSSTYNYVVYRETGAVQGSDYEDFSTFPADTVENDLDRLAMIVQEKSALISSSSNKITAWATFNGTHSSPTVSTSYGVIKQITKNGTGDYTITFSPTMSTVNYAVILSGGGTTNFLCAKIKDSTTISTTAIRIQAINTSFAAVDPAYVSAMIISN